MRPNLNSTGVLLSTANPQMAHLIATDLSRRGIRVEATGDHPASACRFARSIAKFHRTPPVSSGEAYVRAVCAICRNRRLDMFLPACREVFHLAPWRDLLWRETRYPFAGADLVNSVNDKSTLQRLAGQAGVLAPQGSATSFPIVCKPPDGFGARGFSLLETRQELDRWRAKMPSTTDFLFQEFIPGPLLVWMGIRWRGRLRASFAFETVKTTPAFGGTSVLRRSLIDPALDKQSTRLLDFLDYDGFCTLDYIRHESTGADYLIDFNPRFGTSLHAAALAGVSFPHCLLNLVLDRDFEKPVYAAGIVSSSLAGHLGRIVRACPRKPPVRTLLLDALRAFARPQDSEECYSRTPLPLLMPLVNAFVSATPWLGRASGDTTHADDCHPQTAAASRR